MERLLLGSDPDTPLGNEEIVVMIGEAELSGIDAPFGWPVSFVEAVRAWDQFEGWKPGADTTALRYRETDLQVPGPRRPLSVSTDLIGVTAMRCASILEALGPAVDRSGLSGPAIEVYPAASLKRWGLTSTGYKGRARSEVRGRLVAELCERLAGICDLDDGVIRACERSDDALDSLVASVAVRARMRGLTMIPTGPEQLRLARIEGWIHVPDCELSELVG